MTPFEMVAEFHRKFGLRHAVNGPDCERGLLLLAERRLAHLSEELAELTVAIDRGDLPGIADALADLVYLVYGVAVQLGIPLDEVLVEVHAANMRKVATALNDHKLGIAKPAGWQPPDVAGVLERAGWR